jgi:hypothetical protein
MLLLSGALFNVLSKVPRGTVHQEAALANLLEMP